jgi:hypothetical protein
MMKGFDMDKKRTLGAFGPQGASMAQLMMAPNTADGFVMKSQEYHTFYGPFPRRPDFRRCAAKTRTKHQCSHLRGHGKDLAYCLHHAEE